MTIHSEKKIINHKPEDLFDLVKLQAMPPNKFSHRAAAIYLLYALYFKQPARALVSRNNGML